MKVLQKANDNTHQFFIDNTSLRNTADITWENKLNNTDRINVKGSGSLFNRKIATSIFGMQANQFSYYTELNYLKKVKNHTLVSGINVTGEHFKKHLPSSEKRALRWGYPLPALK